MLRKFICNTAWKFYNVDMLKYYKDFKDDEFAVIEILEQKQNTALRLFINHAFKNIPYYREISDNFKIKAEDIRTKKDLECLPILTKEIIKQRQTDFIWNNEKRYKIGRTGGSTGEPLSYFMSHEDYYRGRALQLRAYNCSGYMLGDKLFTLGGGSLVGKANFKKNIVNFISNNSAFSSYGFEDNLFDKMYTSMKCKKKLFIYGYPSSIFMFSDYMLRNKYKLDMTGGIYTTAECLLTYQRETIQEAFPNIHIFDDYGMNDGGLHACECEFHKGMHVNYGRGLLEIVDDQGKQIYEKTGRILATSVYNYKFPFIRYEVGDLATLTNKPCICGRNTPRLISLQGRQTDFIEINGRRVGSPVLTVLMGTLPEIKIYRVVQKNDTVIVFKLCLETNVNQSETRAKVEKTILKSLDDKIPGAEVIFEYYENPLDLMQGTNKFRIVINENISK